MQKFALLTLLIIHAHCHGSAQGQEPILKKPEYKQTRALFGFFTEYVGEIQIDNKGEQNTFDQLPILGLGFDFTTDYNFNLNIEFLLTMPETMGDASGVKKQTYMARFDIVKQYNDQLSLMVGSSWVITNIYGDGGSQTLGNGGSTTDFPKAEGSVYSHNFTLDLSAEYSLKEKWAVRLHTLTYNIQDSDLFRWSYILSLNYYWDYKKLL
jgi:hypothetical protein